MLAVYKGEASRSYENTFFRSFAKVLTNEFERKNMEGVLLGMPKCLLNESLQIDAILLTRNSIILIDFKDYRGDVILPDSQFFRTGQWLNIDNQGHHITIKGGSSVNPFYQLGSQRRKLIRIFDTTKPNGIQLDNRIISTMVCFCDSVSLKGSIPREFKASFFIADEGSYSASVFDIIEVESTGTNLLNEEFLTYLQEKVFYTPKYDLSASGLNTSDPIPPSEPMSSMPVLSSDASTKVKEFINSDSRIMVITGTVGTDKDALITTIRNHAFGSGFHKARLLVYSNRVKNNILKRQEDVESLYAAIYNFDEKTIGAGENNKEYIPLKRIENDWPDDGDNNGFDGQNGKTLEEWTVFIMEESQMITDSERSDPQIQFGSGKLLSDLVEYSQVNNTKSRNKIVFIGDKYQLSFGSWELSCLNPDYYRDISPNVVFYDLPDIENPSPIQEACLQIANSVREDNYTDLYFHDSDEFSLINRKQEKAIVDKVNNHRLSSKILVYKNEQAVSINRYIKTKILKNGENLAQNDFVIFTNQISVYPPDKINIDEPFDYSAQPYSFAEPKRITNGAFGTIIAIIDADRFKSEGIIKDDRGIPIELSFVKAQIKLEDDSVIEVYVLEDFLYNSHSDLSPKQEAEYQVFLNLLKESAMKRDPFIEGNTYFDEMIQSGEFHIDDRDPQNPKFRDPKDKRNLTVYEKKWRKSTLNRLLLDKSSMYYKVFNAARLKFGWCLTVHRAMSYEWENVIFSTHDDRGRTNRDHFVWLYTGISRATHHIDLVRWNPISVFEKTEFGIASSKPSNKSYFISTKSSADDAPTKLRQALIQIFESSSLEIVQSVSNNWEEQITVSDGEAVATMFFNYNKEGQIKHPRFKNGEKTIFEKVQELSHGEDMEVPKSSATSLAKLYTDLKRIIGGAEITVLKSAGYQDIIELHIRGESTLVQIYYTKMLLISKFNFLDGSKQRFDEAVERIRQYYSLEA